MTADLEVSRHLKAIRDAAAQTERAKPKFVFFFPYVPPSGVSSLFVRIGQAISTGAGARLVDFADGAMARLSRETGALPLTEYRRDGTVEIAADETLVLQAEIPSKLRRQLKIHPAAKMIEWQLHPYNLLPPLIPIKGQSEFCLKRPALFRALLGVTGGRDLRTTREFIQLATTERSLFFHDQPALDATEKFLGLEVTNPILLPVPVSVPDQPVRRQRIATDALRVAWVGRLYDFKIHILVHTLRRFRTLAAASGKKFVFYVVGGGPQAAALAELAQETAGLKVTLHGDMSAASLRRLLIEEADVVASMGTAALEGAALGLPVMLLDIAYGEVPAGYQYRWLHQAKGFELGHTITATDCSDQQDSFPRMVAELETNYGEAAARDFAYVREHHSLSSVADRFLALAEAASLRFGTVPARLWHKSPLRRAYERLRY